MRVYRLQDDYLTTKTVYPTNTEVLNPYTEPVADIAFFVFVRLMLASV